MASTVSVRVVIDEKELQRIAASSEGTAAALREDVKKRREYANSLADGYRTGRYHDRKSGETRGNTQARYGSGVKKFRDGYLGIVYTANYAAQKENHEHNTLLKAKG